MNGLEDLVAVVAQLPSATGGNGRGHRWEPPCRGGSWQLLSQEASALLVSRELVYH